MLPQVLKEPALIEFAWYGADWTNDQTDRREDLEARNKTPKWGPIPAKLGQSEQKTWEKLTLLGSRGPRGNLLPLLPLSAALMKWKLSYHLYRLVGINTHCTFLFYKFVLDICKNLKVEVGLN